MRKIVVLVLVMVMMGQLTACGNTKVENTDWTELKFELDGTQLQLPISYSDLEKLGWKIDLEEAAMFECPSTLEPGEMHYGFVSAYNENYPGSSFNISFVNTTDKVLDTFECSIYYIYADASPGAVLQENHPHFEIAGGITFGSTAEEVLAAFGEPVPDRTYVAEDLGYQMWYWDYDGYAKTMSISVSEEYGVIDISLDTFRY